MLIERNIENAPNVENFVQDMLGSVGSCIGCVECDGPCEALIQVMVLPDLILEKTRAHNEQAA